MKLMTCSTCWEYYVILTGHNWSQPVKIIPGKGLTLTAGHVNYQLGSVKLQLICSYITWPDNTKTTPRFAGTLV